LDDVISITGTSYDGTRWYYFYNWEIEAVKSYICTSERLPVTVKVVECTGISEVAGIQDLQIYPNPTEGTFTVSYTSNNAETAVINILNALGQFVVSKNTNGANPSVAFHLEDIAPGTYTVEIISGNRSVHRQIIVE
jgi:hypothetical protein